MSEINAGAAIEAVAFDFEYRTPRSHYRSTPPPSLMICKETSDEIPQEKYAFLRFFKAGTISCIVPVPTCILS